MASILIPVLLIVNIGTNISPFELQVLNEVMLT